jgi:hypothetical protein
MVYLGDFAAAAVVDFMWSSNNGSGASITRTTNGTISVYKGNSTTQSTAGVTDTEDFDSLTGIHHCRIDTSADGAFYAAGSNFMVVLSGATIDGQAVNAVLAHFSIQNRYLGANVIQWNGTAVPTPDTAGYPKVTIKDGTGVGELDTASGKVLLQDGAITAGVIADNAIDAAALAADAGAEIGTAVWSTVSRTLTSSGDPSAATIADAVWDEARSGHTVVGTFGEKVNAQVTGMDANVITAAALAADAGAEIADTVWDEPTAGHTTAGSAGKALTDANNGAPPSAATIADAVWDEAKTGHAGAGSFGEEVQSLATPAEVKAQVVAALTADTYAELGAVPGATSSLKDKLTWLFMIARNKHVTTATQDRLRNDGDSADIGTAALGDDGTAFTRGKYS